MGRIKLPADWGQALHCGVECKWKWKCVSNGTRVRVHSTSLSWIQINICPLLLPFTDLSRNRFAELPEEVTTFAFLETLLLYHNTIRSIPESVKQLSSLTYLDLRSNQLSSLPREICFLPLQVLLVSNNRLTSLPDELGRLDQTLTDLDASYNQLANLPARLGELRSLRSLSLRSNHLLYLPRELTCLSLISLDVSNNKIASLPLEIRHMSTLVELQLENNPLTSPPASVSLYYNSYAYIIHILKNYLCFIPYSYACAAWCTCSSFWKRRPPRTRRDPGQVATTMGTPHCEELLDIIPAAMFLKLAPLAALTTSGGIKSTRVTTPAMVWTSAGRTMLLLNRKRIHRCIVFPIRQQPLCPGRCQVRFIRKRI